MRLTTLTALCALAAPTLAQNYYIPNNDPTTGTPNVIPFGSSTPGGSFYNGKMQVRATAAELGAAGNLITGLGFACNGTGNGTYAGLEIVMDHIPNGQPLSTTFDNNLTPNAITVLSATNYTWNLTADTWSEVGLQTFFPFNGVDDVIIQITVDSGVSPAGMRRGTNQRLYWIGASGPPAATGTLSNSATKFEVSMLTARTSTYGVGCPGSNGTPELSFSGSAQVGNALFTDLSNGVPSGFALFIAGSINTAPYPLELSVINMPGCYAYTDLSFVDVIALDPAGSGSYPFAIPATGAGGLFYAQFACLDPAANTFGFTSSNYGRVLGGN